ncbi:transmembrane protein 43 homolog [Onthophagus taurus]|uniref:transmembrane protein 43 homolog n=1 Tax=Onthophagus taurus TaxID=166361 RepID=UPI0039BE2B99
MEILSEFKKNGLINVVGIVAFCLSNYLLITNELKSMNQTTSLSKAYEDVIPLNPYEPVRPELDGHLIHVTAPLGINEPLTAPEYGVSIQSVKLKRRVQMYQWVEEKRDHYTSAEARETEYYYIQEWRDKLVDSRNFYIRHNHQNPSEKPLQTYEYVSPVVKVGQFNLGTDLKQKFDNFIEFTSDQRPEGKDVKLHMGIYYHCYDIWNPKTGDIRVQLYYAGLNGDIVTVIAQQYNGVLIPYPTVEKHEIAMLRYGELSISEMFHAEHADIRWKTWEVRIFGWLLMYGCFLCLSNTIYGILVNTQIGVLLRNNLLNESILTQKFILSISFTIISASSTWLFVSPHTALAIIIAALTPIFYITFLLYTQEQLTENRRLL